MVRRRGKEMEREREMERGGVRGRELGLGVERRGSSEGMEERKGW
jgi:hypothetical protein